MTTRREFLGAAGLLLFPGTLLASLAPKPPVVTAPATWTVSKRKLLFAIKVMECLNKYGLTDWTKEEIKLLVDDVWDVWNDRRLAHAGEFDAAHYHKYYLEAIDRFLQACAHPYNNDVHQSRRPYKWRMEQNHGLHTNEGAFSGGPAQFQGQMT